jgi:Ca2+:H+ antiporter
MKAGTRRFGVHTRDALFHSWVNILLIFVPIGIASEVAHLNPAIVFAMNSIAIIPLAGLLSHATESVATRLGDTLGALLNVSFGNAVELIIL